MNISKYYYFDVYHNGMGLKIMHCILCIMWCCLKLTEIQQKIKYGY